MGAALYAGQFGFLGQGFQKGVHMVAKAVSHLPFTVFFV